MRNQIINLVKKYFITCDEKIQNEICKILKNVNFAKDYYNLFLKKKIGVISKRKFENDVDNYIYKYFYNLYVKGEEINVEKLYSFLYRKFHKLADRNLITKIKKIRKKAYLDYYYVTYKKKK